MTTREQVAAAMAFFEASDDIVLLRRALGEVAPRARRMVTALLTKGGEDALPPPADLRAAKDPATADQSFRSLRGTDDFSLLQVLARSIGRRVETIEIAASADFPEGVRVRVPEKPVHPTAGRRIAGTVEVTGTTLQVLLDNGETWEGPPSLAELERGA